MRDIKNPKKYQINGIKFKESSCSDIMTRSFRNAVKIEVMKSKIAGVPVAKYDKTKNRVYMEYPDGTREYQ